jgi:hypothetical protein
MFLKGLPGWRSVMPANKKPWTDEENERLKALVAKDESVIKAAAIFRRSIANVRNQARKLGTPFSTMKEYRKKFGDSASNP